MWGAQLKAGRSRSCGKAGCRTRSKAPEPADMETCQVAPEDEFIFRTWCELLEVLNEDNWRCRDAHGTPFPVIHSVAPNIRSWEVFRQWTRGEFVMPEFNVMKQNYMEGKVLACSSTPTCRPINRADPNSPPGVVATYQNLEWVWPGVAREEGRILVIKPPKTKWYLWEGRGPVMDRKQLADRYSVPYTTLISRVNRGWTTKEACHSKKDKTPKRY